MSEHAGSFTFTVLAHALFSHHVCSHWMSRSLPDIVCMLPPSHSKVCCCMCRVCTAAFAQAMLAGETQPGVWFPEEREALQNRRALLQSSAEGCVRFELNRPPWALESAPRRLGFGIYID